MKIVPQNVELLTSKGAVDNMVLNCERAARACYNSLDKQTGNVEDAVVFLRSLLDRHHESVIEHSAITFELTTNIGVSREFERHRLATIDYESDVSPSMSERSTRYCNYSKESKYPNGIEFCFNKDVYEKLTQCEDLEWVELVNCNIECAEIDYNELYNNYKMKPEFCRHLLPLCTKTVFVSTCNLREWRHIIKMRTAKSAHPDIRELGKMIYDKLCSVGLKMLFEDVYTEVDEKKEV